ncbi:MAG: hypothetical protein GY716_10690 [bacterium]|nr:hypothetical protein [bacterium]
MRVVFLLLSIVVFLSGCGSVPPEEVARIEDGREAESRALVRTLDSGDPGERARAALAMGRIQSPYYAASLARASAAEPREVRLASLFALGQLGLREGAVVPSAAPEACLAAFEDPDPEIVATAVEAFGKLAPSGAEERIVPLLEHESATVRAEACRALFRLRFVPLWRKEAEAPPELSDETVAALSERLEDVAAEVREAAVYVFSRYGDQRIAIELLDRLTDDAEWVRLFAIRGLGQAGYVRAAPRIAAALADESSRVRVEAVSALDRLDRPDLLPATRDADPSFHVRAALADALGGAAGAGDEARLEALAADPSSSVRAAAIEALARRRKAAYRDELARLLRDDSWTVRAAAARATASLDEHDAELFDLAFADADTRVRTAALGALEARDGVDSAIQVAIASDDLAVRGSAVALAAQLDAAARLPLFERAYDDSPGESWIEIRESIVDALEDETEAEALLRRIAEDDTAPSVRSRAALVLRKRGLDVPQPGPRKVERSRFLREPLDGSSLVVLETSKGTIEIRVFADRAPVHAASFVDLVRSGFYDGLIWHRVVPNFVIQGGDPRGDGWGSHGETLRDEINRARYGRGAVGMPKAGKDTGGCQIFITHVPTPHLDGNYTIFGQVTAGLDVVDEIEVGDRIVSAHVRE